jgi:hypothetical protein
LEDIGRNSQRNINKAIGFLERYILRNETVFTPFVRTDYDDTYAISTKIVNTIIKGTEITSTIDEIRSLIYELLTFCMEPRHIIPDILEIALKRLPKRNGGQIYNLCQYATLRDATIRCSSKQMYHIESFCIYLFDTIKTIMAERVGKQK